MDYERRYVKGLAVFSYEHIYPIHTSNIQQHKFNETPTFVSNANE